MYKEDLALNNLTMFDMTGKQTKLNPVFSIYMYKEDLIVNNLSMVDMP